MKRFASPCPCHRETIALLVSGALTKSESAEIEAHLAGCQNCRDYFSELKIVAVPLASWERHFTHLEPARSVQAILAEEIAGPKLRSSSLSLTELLLECYRQLILPSRRIWAGLTLVWLGVFIANHQLGSDGPKVTASTSTRSADFILTLREQEQMMAELTFQSKPAAVEPPKRFVPRPRSEARENFLLT